jgi:hypothetical protein
VPTFQNKKVKFRLIRAAKNLGRGESRILGITGVGFIEYGPQFRITPCRLRLQSRIIGPVVALAPAPN